MKYKNFQQLIDTMNSAGYDCEKEIIEVENRRKALSFTNNESSLKLSEHVKTMIYAQLSNNRPWYKFQDKHAHFLSNKYVQI